MIWNIPTIEQNKLDTIKNRIDGSLIADRLSYNLGISKTQLLQYIDIDNIKVLLATLLINRNLEDNADILSKPQDYLLNPHDLYNADKAAKEIYSYCMNPDAIIYIYADYDADGLTSGYVMTKALQEVAKCRIKVHYPNREEGYGLSMKFCEDLISRHKDSLTEDVLVVTVDNGVTKVQEIDYLKANGIDVVVTDHHQSKDIVPNCTIVDPHNNTVDQGDTFKHLCGCGVAFKVAQLVQELHGINNMYTYFPYLAIATITDVMPMHTENLAILQYGLDIINSKNCPVGIAEYKAQENIDYLTTKDIGWTLGPMLNACGRMGDTELGSKLFFTDNEPIADVVSKIKSINDQRKNKTKNAVKELSKMPVTDDKVFIWNTNKYPNGIVGIIAGKASELFNKPSIIVSKADKKSNIVHGSARSANGIDLMPIMEILKNQGLIIEYGGHSEAIGLHFYEDKTQDIINAFNELIQVEYVEVDELEDNVLNIDEVLTLDNLNVVMLALSNILPTDGKELPTPTFAVTDCEVKSYKVYPSGYMEITLKQGNTLLDMSAMGYAQIFSTEILPQLSEMDKKLVHIAGTISKHFKTKKYVLNIVDIVVAC